LFFALVAGSFEVHGLDTHDFRLKKALYGLMHAPQVLYFKIVKFLLKLGFSKFSADFNSLFDRSDPLIVALYTNDFIIAGSLEQLMFWCKKILTSETEMKDKAGWQVDEVFFVQRILMKFSLYKGFTP
jgi:hypothetical protein